MMMKTHKSLLKDFDNMSTAEHIRFMDFIENKGFTSREVAHMDLDTVLNYLFIYQLELEKEFNEKQEFFNF